MKKCVVFTVWCLFSPVLAAAQITNVTLLQGNIPAADDYATRAFQDPWDMNERTDFGWWLYSSDAPFTNLVNPVFSNGTFSATVAGTPGSISQASLFLLETRFPPVGSVGKIGTNYPINAAAYTHLVFRMRVNSGTSDTLAATGRLLWSPTTIYDGETQAGSIILTKGWFIYDVNIPSLSLIAGPNIPWGGVIRSLRWMPTQLGGEALDIDWVRLVQNDPNLYRTMTWTGSNNADVYLDDDNDPGNGTLGRIATGVAGGSYSFFFGSLPGGNYWAVVVPRDAPVNGSSARSAGFIHVNDIPRLAWVTPSDEGSNDDFATAKLANPWDFNAMSDIDLKVGIQPGDAIGPMLLENEAGTSAAPQNVYTGVSEPGSAISGGYGDPQLYMIFWDYKGKTIRIDPNRYRILTAEFGIPNLPRSLNDGSIGRILWRVAGEPKRNAGGLPSLNTSQAFVFNHKAGSNVLARVTVDMKTLGLDPGSDSTTGWNSLPDPNPGIEAFRFDAHEFPNPTQFYVKRLKLAALDKTLNGQYTFRWSYNEPSGNLTLFLDSSSTRAFNPATSTLVAQNLDATTGSYTWNSTVVPDGTYYVYAVVADGVNSNAVYAPWPIVINNTSGTLPTILLNRATLNYGIVGTTRTSSQMVRVGFSGPGSQCWTAAANNANVSVSPSGGNGPGVITISASGAFALGTTNALVSVSSCADGSNSTAVSVVVRVVNSSTLPAGVFDSPGEGSAAIGSLPVTGWAVDDIQVARVTICRGAVAGESPVPNPSCGNQPRIYIGDAVLVDDARPDVEALASTSPFNYRAGWGYLMLTNFLPNNGNGTFTLYTYAIDKEGQTVQLGSRTIVAQNNSSTRPFGTIDTPGQGETICGTQYANFGWALTQSPKTIPPDGSSITVFIDNLPVGKPGALSPRADISASFPGYNTNNAVGAFVFDTTAYSNGVHAIAWVVTDSGGNSEGIGSRFFTIANPCSGS